MKKNVVSIIRIILIQTAIIVLGGFILIAAMTLIYSIPLNRANFFESLEILKSEGDRPDVLERNSGEWANANSFEPGIVLTTDEVANVYRAAGVDGMSPLYNVVVMDAPDWGPYARYWHAHVGIIRILLMVMDIKEMRFFFFIIQLVSVLSIMMLVREKKGVIPSFLIMTFYILNMPLAVSAFTDYSICFCGVLIFTYFILWRIKKSNKVDELIDSGLLYVLFCVMGCIVCATDQLITCIISWGLPILLIIYLFCEDRSVIVNLKTVVLSGCCWIYGYAGFWIFKIAFATVFLHENIFADALMRTEAWTEGTEAVSEGRLFSLLSVYKHYTYKLYAVIIVLWIVFLVLRMIFMKAKFDSRIPSLFLIALGPVTWGFVLYEHIYYHHIMTYRQFSITVIAILFLLYSATENYKKIISGEILKRFIQVFVVFIVSFALTSFIKESEDVTNADIPGYFLDFDEKNPVMEMNIIPRYKQISEISFGLCTDSTEGVFVFDLYDGDRLIDEHELSAEKFAEWYWQAIKVDWKLAPNKNYTLVISAVGVTSESQLYVLTSDFGMINDVSGLKTGNNLSYTQPIAWIKYKRPPIWRDYIFYTFSWGSCILALLMSSLCLLKSTKWDYIILMGDKANL